MSRKDYDILGIPESATDEEVTARYEELKKKYSEDRFLEGEAGNEAARMLNRIEVAYNEIMTERGERHTADDMGGSYAKVDAYIREGKINEAQAVLDEFNERPAEWHYLQSAVFYKKNWVNESKKQLEIAFRWIRTTPSTGRRTPNSKTRSRAMPAARRTPTRRHSRTGRVRSSLSSPIPKSSRWAAAGCASSARPAVRATSPSTAA